MKTRFLPLFALCGLVSSSGLAASAVDSNPPQPVDTASAVPASGAPQFSGRINEVVSLTKSGVDQSIVLSFIKNSPGPFTPSADEIIKLRDMGISTPVLTAMLERGGELRDQAHAAVAAAAPEQSAANPSQAPVISETPPSNYSDANYATPPATPPASTVTYIGGDYGYPYYSYPYYYPTYYSGYYSSAFFYPFPCWFGGVYYAHGCYFPHGGYIHDGFHVHDGFHGGFHGGFTGGFHGGVAGGFHGGFGGGFHGTPISSGFHGGFSGGGFHSGPVGGGFHGSIGGGGFHGGTMGGGFHGGSIGGGFHGGGMGGGGFHGGGGGGGHR